MVKHGSNVGQNAGQTLVRHLWSSWWVAGSWTSLDLVVRLEERSVCLTFNTIFLPLLYFVTHRKQYLSINLGFIPWIIRCRHTFGNKILRSYLQMGLYIAFILHFLEHFILLSVHCCRLFLKERLFHIYPYLLN